MRKSIKANPKMKPIDAWQGGFGNEYQKRNGPNWKSVKHRLGIFENIMEKMGDQFPRENIMEVGAGCGDNLRAIDMIYARSKQKVQLIAAEPNKSAQSHLGDVADVIIGDAATKLSFQDQSIDMVFTSGVLIHIPPADLGKAMREIHRVSRRWIGCIEYFNPTPEETPYRENTGLMWRRDYGTAWLEAFPSLRPVMCGFAWKPLTGLDNVTYWLFEKPQA